MTTIPHRSSDCQIAISTDNSQVTKRCQGTKTTDGKIEWVHMICDVGHLCSRVNTSTYLYIEYSGNVRSVTAKLHIITIAGYWRDLVRAKAMIRRVLKTNDKKARIKFRGRKNLVANVKYLVLNITWKVSNQACLGRKLAGIARSHGSILN